MQQATLTQRTRKAGQAALIIAILPALMALMAYLSGTPELAPLIYGGSAFAGGLIVLGIGLFLGTRTAIWIAVAASAFFGGAMIVSSVISGGSRVGVLIGISLIAVAVPRLLRLRADLAAQRRARLSPG